MDVMLVPPRDPSATVSMWPPLLAVVGPGGRSRRHAHHAWHVLLCEKGTLSLEMENGTRRTCSGVITRPDVAHAIDAEGRQVMLVFIEPESAAGERLASAITRPIATLSAKARDALLARVGPAPAGGDPLPLRRWADALVDALVGDRAPVRRVHPRVRRLLAMLRDLPPDADTSLPVLAAMVDLSPGRLMHVFTESVGIPLRPYLLWLKLQRAAAAVSTGRSLTAAAAEGGFSDAAHMTRTFQQHFGLPPSALLRPQPVHSRRSRPEGASSRA
jgi:AraC-like DNA-binding protein